MEETFVDKLPDGGAGPEGAGKADVRTAQEGGGAGVVEREKVPHLR